MTRSLLVLLLALSGATACKKKSDAPDCKAAASTYAALVKEQIDHDTGGKDTDGRRAQALSLIPSLKEEMAKACEKNKWTEGTRICIKDAKAAADLPHCMPKKAEAAAETPAEPPAAPDQEPAPADQPKPGE